jgi:hypothetical protein
MRNLLMEKKPSFGIATKYFQKCFEERHIG